MKPFKFFRDNNEPVYWLTAMGDIKLISTMSVDYMVNVTIMITDGYIPNPYIGRTHIEWMEIFEQEMRNRQTR
jgi:desulfoferrodoxin (superoxide reductase-like protein)